MTTLRKVYYRNVFRGNIAVPMGLANPTERNQQHESQLSEEVRRRWERQQDEMKKRMILVDEDYIPEMLQGNRSIGGRVFYVAGVDISFVKNDDVNACVALVVLSYPDLKEVYRDCKMIELTEPYIPGFLGFREAPFILKLFNTLKQTSPEFYPDVVLVDGNGILHPKGFGSACHIGVCLDIPCVGVAKKLFQVGGLEKNEEHKEKIKGLRHSGDTFPLVVDSGETLGMALRSSRGSQNPIYVSPGHRITMETAVKLVHSCCKYRVPEPIRLADMKSRDYILNKFTPTDRNNDQDPE